MEKFNIINFIKKAVSIGASDIHLHTDEYPSVRVNGQITKIDMPKLTGNDIKSAASEIIPEGWPTNFDNLQDMDFAYELVGVARFRVNISKQLGKFAIAIRVIPYKIRTIEELCLPKQIYKFTDLLNGLVLVTGPTGSGKSTTIAAMIDHINATQQKHIITLEDPIEHIFTDKKSIVSQRQLYIDTPTFGIALRYALRQDPDIIFIGEIRDTKTMTSALKAAETGHLVFATLHTNNAVQTVNRIVNMYTPPSDRPYIRTQLAEILRGTISQRLLPLANGNGRKPACEILTVTPTIQDLIKKDELEQAYSLVKNGSLDNMMTLNSSLYKMIKKGEITEDIALSTSADPNELKQMLRGVFTGTGINLDE